MIYRKRFLLFSLYFLFSINTILAAPFGHPSTSAEIEKIYAPFDSLRTNPNDYIWPTYRYLPLTSSFADFRTSHFHAGIDISTFGKKGFPVYASRSGYVSHISISPIGYGKMICIRHIDGFSTRYAHLQKFNNKIESYVETLQRKNGIYPLEADLQAEEFPVEQGDLIAYTGNTGVGDAHLHFEILDEEMNPINPLLFPSFARVVNDRHPPRFRQIAFSPLQANSSVHGECRPWIADVQYLDNNEFKVPGVIHINGAIGISIHASDIIGKSDYENRANLYECFLDGIKYFTSTIVRFPEKEYKQIALYYDWDLYRNGDYYFQKMYIENGNHLPFYQRQPEGSGILETNNLSPGLHKLRVVARDLQGNSSTLIAELISNTSPHESLNIEKPLQVEHSHGQLSPIPDDDGTPETIQGSSYVPTSTTRETCRISSTSLLLQKQFYRDYIVITISSHLPFTMRPSVWINTPTKRILIDISALEANRYFGTYTFHPDDQGRILIDANADINGARNVQAYDEFDIYPITPETGGVLSSTDGLFTATFPTHSVYQTLYCRMDRTANGYALQPDVALLDEGVNVEFRIPERLRHSHVGLFLNNTFGFALLDWTKPFSKEVLSGHINRFLGEFSLLTDDTPPQITHFKIRYRSRMLNLSFNIRDDISGVDSQELRIKLDGEPIIAEYNPYRASVLSKKHIKLHSGNHILNIDFSDQMGNVSTIQKLFYVR